MKINKVALCTSMLLSAGSAYSANYYINDNATAGDIYCLAAYNAGTHNGTAANPSGSFAELLTDIGTLAAGDFVYIDAGTYTWTTGIIPNASGAAGNAITIQGAGIANTTITVTLGMALISNDNDYITVSGINLINNTDKVCSISANSQNWTISNCRLESSNQHTLYFTSGANCNNHAVSNTTIISTGQMGIYAGAAVNNLVFTNCTVNSTNAAAYESAANVSNVTFTSCTLSNSNSTLLELGDTQSNYTFTNCTLTAASGKGLFVGGPVASSNFTITGGSISATSDHAIIFQGNVSNVTISNITATSSNNSPIRFNSIATTVNMSNSTFTSNAGGAVVFFISRGSGFDVSTCTFTSLGTGVAMEVDITGTSDFNFHNNCVFNPGTNSNAISVAVNSTNYRFTDCTMNGKNYGLLVQGGSSNYTLTNCTISSDIANAVQIEGASTGYTMTGCTLTSTIARALHLTAVASNYNISNSTFSGNINDGAVTINSGNVGHIVVDNCTITNPANGGYGIILRNSSKNCKFINNTITCSGTQNTKGIYLDNGSSTDTVEHNTITLTTNGAGLPTHGIWTGTGNDNIFKRNVVKNGDVGIFLGGGGATGIILDNNHISNAVLGVFCNTASFNGTVLVHNSFYTTQECIYGPFLNWDVRDNIFYTTGNASYSCVFEQLTFDPLLCDYNLYYHPNGANCVRRNNINYATLALFRNLFNSNDVNSIGEFDPLYTNPVADNLFPNTGSPAAANGLFLRTADLPGTVRSNPPTIGAYESAALPCGDTTLTSSIPNRCISGLSFDLDAYIGTAAPGTWSITGGPGGYTAALAGDGHTFNINFTAAGTYVVTHTLTTVNPGCPASSTRSFIINALPVPVVADQEICLGDPAATFDAGAGFSSYTWSDNGAGVAQTTSGTTAGNYTVTVTNAAGCSASASGVLRVNALPAPTVADQQICLGDPAATFDAGAGFSSYTWSANGIGNAQTTSGSVAGNYTVTVTNAKGCLASSTGALTVNALPTPTVANQQICLGDPAATFDAGIGFTTYAWSVNGSGNAQTTSGSAAGNYTITVTNAFGCSASETGVLIVNALPVPVVADHEICLGDPAATFDAGAGFTTYAWSDNGSGNAQTTSGTSPGNYSVIVTNAAGCSASAFGVLTVNALPIVLVSNEIICNGDSAIFDAGSGFASYTWSANGTGNAQTTKGKIAGSYTVTVTNFKTCSASATGTLTVNTPPNPQLGNDTSMCQGLTVVLDPGTLNSLTYSWTPGLQSGATLAVNTTGGYKVTVSDGAGCKGSDSVFVQVHSLPFVTLGNDATVCDNNFDKVTLHAQYTGTQQLQWSTLENNVDSVLISLPGSYWVQVTDSNSCSATDTAEVTVHCDDYTFEWPDLITPNGDGINDIFKPKGVDDSNFQKVVANIHIISFAVYDRWGLLMFSSQENILPNWDAKFNSDPVAPGTYYFIINYSNSAGKTYEIPGYMTVMH